MARLNKLLNSRPVYLAHTMVSRYLADGVGRNAAALAYYLVFSFFPFLIFVSTAIGFFNLPQISVETFSKIIPADIINIINTFLEHVSELKSGQLLTFGLIMTIYFTMRSVDCLFRAICRAYRMKETRPFLRHQITVFLYTVFLMVAILLSLFLLTSGRSLLTFVAKYLPIDLNWISFWNVERFFLLAVVLYLTLSVLYYLVPERKYTYKQVMPGTLASLFSWLAFSIGFAFYVEHMANYSLLYGSIGAIIVLLLWLYFTGITLIMGAELNFILIESRLKRPSFSSWRSFFFDL